jgi:uncharacterized protein (TIGR02246 family)
MRTPHAMPLLVGFVCAAIATPAAQSGTPADIVKMTDTYVKACLAGDARAVAALYTDDAVEMPPYQPMVKGRAAIESYYTGLFGGPAKLQSFQLTHLDTKASGDIGYDVGTYRETITDGQHPMTQTGNYTVLAKRTSDGWKVTYAIYNSDTPPVPHAPQ